MSCLIGKTADTVVKKEIVKKEIGDKVYSIVRQFNDKLDPRIIEHEVKQMKLQVIQDCKKIEKDFEQIYKLLDELNNMSLDEK